jgi:hypothetical protein
MLLVSSVVEVGMVQILIVVVAKAEVVVGEGTVVVVG